MGIVPTQKPETEQTPTLVSNHPAYRQSAASNSSHATRFQHRIFRRRFPWVLSRWGNKRKSQIADYSTTPERSSTTAGYAISRLRRDARTTFRRAKRANEEGCSRDHFLVEDASASVSDKEDDEAGGISLGSSRYASTGASSWTDLEGNDHRRRSLAPTPESAIGTPEVKDEMAMGGGYFDLPFKPPMHTRKRQQAEKRPDEMAAEVARKISGMSVSGKQEPSNTPSNSLPESVPTSIPIQNWCLMEE